MNVGGKWAESAITVLAIAILIVMASFQTTSGQEDANAADVNAGVVQQPCGNVTQYLESKGLIEPPYRVWWTGDLERERFGHQLKYVTFYSKPFSVVDCDTGEVYDHVPSFAELGIKVPEEEVIEIALNRNLSVTPDHLYQVEETGAEVLGVKCRINSPATRSQIETINGYEWPSSVSTPYDWVLDVPPDEKIRTIHLNSQISKITPEKLNQIRQTGAKVHYSTCYMKNIGCKIYASATDAQLEAIAGYSWVSDITPDGKILVYVRSNSAITSVHLDQVKQTGADVESFICWIFANATKSQRETVEGYDWVKIVGPQPGGIGGGGRTTIQPTKLRMGLVANSIDHDLASDFTAFMENKGMEVVHADASNFDQHSSEMFVVILGGPDASEGVGEIVQEVLDGGEQDYLRARGSRRMYVKPNVWTQGQVVIVIAGSDRYGTQKAHEENREVAYLKIKGK